MCKCGPGLTECNGTMCVNTTNDPLHCGMCNKACAADRNCVTSNCVCKPGLTECVVGTCTDTQTDKNHCGVCNKVCPGQKECVAGNCQ